MMNITKLAALAFTSLEYFVMSKEDLLAIEREMEIMKAKLDEKQKHKETLEYFLDTIDFE